MNSKNIGDIGEAKVLTKFLELGYDVYLPFGENTRIDMIVNINGELCKIQVKTSQRYKNGYTKFNLASNVDRGVSRYVYTEDDIDYFALYSVINDEIYLIHVNDAPDIAIQIRNTDAKLSMKTIRKAEDYLIDNVLEKINTNAPQ